MVKCIQGTWKEDTTMTFREQNGQTVIGSVSHDTQTRYFNYTNYKYSADEATEIFQPFTVMQLSLPFFRNMSPCQWVTGVTPQKNSTLKSEELQNAMY